MMGAATLDRPRWLRLSELFDQALDLPESARAGWLAGLTEAAGVDASLVEQLTRMLAKAAADTAPDQAASPTGFDALLQHALQQDEEGSINGASDLTGRRMGAWALLCKIGEGGMGQVWLARRADGLYEQEVVVKLLRGDLQQASLSERFARERAVLGRLNHPGIAKLLDAGIEAGLPFLVLEYVDGRTLTEHVRAACPTVAERVTLLIRVAQAVEHAHAQLVVHRDLKPTNVMVSLQGNPKVLDFGIAGLLDDEAPGELTRLSGRGLTLGYAAPEQLSGSALGVAVDVYSLGVLLFELLAGWLPFATEGQSRAVAEHALLHLEAPRLGQLLAERSAGRPEDFARVRGDLEAIVAKALRKDPALRYAGVGAFADDLRRWLAHRPVGARRDDWRHRSSLWLRRNALPATLGGSLALAVLAGLGVSLAQWQRADAAAHQSDQVTLYLTNLLGSASPDLHGGESPNVLQLLEKSRTELGGKFKDEPATKLRLLEVLASTYESLNRFDLAAPLAEEWVGLAVQLYGEDDLRTMEARHKLLQIYNPAGPWDEVIRQIAALRPRVARLVGQESEFMRSLLFMLAQAQMRTGQGAAAELTMQEASVMIERQFPPGSFERAHMSSYKAAILSSQGRWSEALREYRKTEQAQAQISTAHKRHALAWQRSILALQMRLGLYEQVEPRAQAMGAEIDSLLGPGSSLRAALYPEMARYHSDRGEFGEALKARQAVLSGSNGTPRPALVASRAALLHARGMADDAPAAALLAEAQELLTRTAADSRQLGPFRRSEAWLALARTGLLLDDQALATDAIQRLRDDGELHLREDRWLNSQVAQVEGELLRARGDWQGSRKLLAQRVDLLAAGADQAVPAVWQARLDLATTLVMMGDPEAAAALALAASARPPQMPKNHPLDAVLRYLELLEQGGNDASVHRARFGVEQAYGRTSAKLPARLGGVF
ncbi:serine/threonine-protein kinase [Roseateles albus]|uniref:Serine/threonine-protein kinase n=1 Tax=Roseateles albus TaxID=2987525 RepID=A0ABT5K877_9BURK|nr:serine/threonine-protein kinase [Roseateles albus]MDC8769975.1 serine/threonine-protein kinase [Roseateles albus]